MCHKMECAFRNANGECLMTHCACDGIGLCQSGVRRAGRIHGQGGVGKDQHFDLGTKNGRFRSATRDARGVVVYRMCLRKKRYPDEYEARRIAKIRTQDCQKPLRVYECPFCKGYHLTSHMNSAA